MKLYVAFQASATQITGITIQSGVATFPSTFATAITRGDG